MKHFIITGKNGSGKTSLIEALSRYLNDICGEENVRNAKKPLRQVQKNLNYQVDHNREADTIEDTKKSIEFWQNTIYKNDSGLEAEFNKDIPYVNAAFKRSEFVLACFNAERKFEADEPKHIEKIRIKDSYSIYEEPRKEFIKYLVDKKVSQSLYQTKNDLKKAKVLATWFNSFEALLRDIYEDQTLILDFDIDSFSFHIIQDGRDAFDFNTMSAGYAAVLDIAVGIIMRMEHQTGGQFVFDMPGIVLIDELEAHLHYELQKKILPFLCKVFPNIQFIISTHSAFILNSISNAVIYDLEKEILVKDGLSEYPYEGIIEGYFKVSTLAEELKEKFDRYKKLVTKNKLTNDDYSEIARLSLFLDEIPDYLALDLTTEYQRLKMEFMHRKDTHG